MGKPCNFIMNIADFGAVGDGKTLNTRALQAAIDLCSARGGVLDFFPGIYLTGTLRLKSRVTLNLNPGATLMGSPDICDYDPSAGENRYLNEHMLDRCLIYAEGERDIALTGAGEINGNKAAFPNADDPLLSRPMMVRFDNCSRIRLESLQLIDSAGWTTAFLRCENVFARGLHIHNMPHPHGTADGLDFDACRNVLISDCNFNTGDDCVCLQNSYAGTVCENVAVTNCVMTGKWAGFRIGMASAGDIRDVTVSNIVMHDLGCSGLKIQSAEGGCLSDMTFNNIVMRNVPRSVFVTLNHFPLTLPSGGGIASRGSVHDLFFSNIRHVNEPGRTLDENHGIVVFGEPGCPIHNLLFRNISMTLPGGGKKPVQPIREIAGCRPEYFEFDKLLPSSAVYLRHAQAVLLDAVSIQLLQEDERPPFVCEEGDASVDSVRIYSNFQNNGQ